MVTYGGMSKQPIIVPTSHLIFKGIALQGFWMVMTMNWQSILYEMYKQYSILSIKAKHLMIFKMVYSLISY